MTSQRSAHDADPGDAAAVTSIDVESPDFDALDLDAPDDPTGVERSEQLGLVERETGTYPKAFAANEGSLDSAVVEELTRRLPTSELVKIIKGALEFGRRNLPFTESDLLRAMTFGSSALSTQQAGRGNRVPRG